ncbi:Dipeptidase 1 [Portunus trituberculatus]|uniref:Dipeptidase 1 n=1 Tax=Portunus trituberculatus TaxID=210409 RepID=A0A5B7GF64_PORTR|nr:Dipeptidase 1 [Portunus trituberculatus]
MCPSTERFWAAYVPCGAQYLNAAQVTLEQIDVLKRLIARYPQHLGYAHSHASKFSRPHTPTPLSSPRPHTPVPVNPHAHTFSR